MSSSLGKLIKDQMEVVKEALRSYKERDFQMMSVGNMIKLQLEVIHESMEKIQSIKKLRKITMSDAVNISIAVGAIVIEAVESGATVKIEHKDGSSETIEIPTLGSDEVADVESSEDKDSEEDSDSEDSDDSDSDEDKDEDSDDDESK